jgi:hypothetical protein
VINVHRRPPTATPFTGQIEGNFFRTLENRFKFSKLIAVSISSLANKNSLISQRVAIEMCHVQHICHLPALAKAANVSARRVHSGPHAKRALEAFQLALIKDQIVSIGLGVVVSIGYELVADNR